MINMKCYKHHSINSSPCKKNSCRYWVESEICQNCTIIGASLDKKFTLEEIGKIFDVTRMRICQVEKIAIEKIKDKVLSIME